MTTRGVGPLLTVALLAGCTSSGGVSFGGGDTSVPVVFTLTGTASGADITYSVGDGGSEQQQNVAVPLVNRAGEPGLHFTASQGDFLYFSAQNNGGGSLTCTITADGSVVATHTSRGRFSVVQCDGNA